MKLKKNNISVIIPCRNEEAYIGKTLNRVIEQKGAGVDFTYEILVIDGLSDDKTVDIIHDYQETYKNIRLIINKKKITPVAFNLGIVNSTGDYICILGAHAEIENDYLLSCFNTIKTVDADNVGGPWHAKGNGFIGEAIALAFQNPVAIGGAKSHNINYEGYVDSVWGGFYRRDIFERIGLFDEELIRNQDDELNFRLIKAGAKIWQSPKIKYRYYSRDNFKSLAKQYYQYGFWKYRVHQKHNTASSLRHIIPTLFIFSLIINFLLFLINSNFIYILILELISYFILLFLGTVLTAFKTEIKYIIIMPIVFIIFHFSYGYGYLKGILHFGILKKHRKELFNDMSISR